MDRADSDRNLLFGILALQMDFVGRDALVEAMNAWVLEKHRPLGEILEQRGTLDPNHRRALEFMVAAHVEHHQGHPSTSLKALTSAREIADRLRRSIVDAEVLESLSQIPSTEDNDDNSTRPYIPSAPSNLARYQKVRDHAKGGLGVVFVALDSELNREVALKEIREKLADDPSSRGRFLVEAEVTGRLEHPGIVPVYGLGHYDDGRPFYAMRLIKGESLKETIDRFHADATLADDPGRRALALQKLLRSFLDVCNAVAYAHSRGVIHRDLKPKNVMVGRFGETIVVDWGLAKVGRGAGADGLADDPDGPMAEPKLIPAALGGSDVTLPGSVVGTPAFMPPEQAAGRIDLVGPRSDVYSLGAMLYYLLTGRAPFEVEETTDDRLGILLKRVEAGEFPRPRTLKGWLDPSLEAVCLKAMARRPVDRYETSRAMAEEVERWIADEPVDAHREPWSRRARRWARRHRTAVTAVASTILVASAILIGVAVLLRSQRQRVDFAAIQTLGQAGRLEIEALAVSDPETALARQGSAIAEARRALAQVESGGGSTALKLRIVATLDALKLKETQLRDTIRAEQRDRRMLADLEEARLLRAEANNLTFQNDLMHEAFLTAFRTYGIDVSTLTTDEAARRIRSSKIAPTLVGVLDLWSWSGPGLDPARRLLAISRAADPTPEAEALRRAIGFKDTGTLLKLVSREDWRRQNQPHLQEVFAVLAANAATSTLPILETICHQDPSSFWLNHDLALVCHAARPVRIDMALRHMTAAIALRPDSPGARYQLASLLLAKGDVDGAIVACRDAIALKPGYLSAQFELGHALFLKKDNPGALVEFRRAITLKPDFAEAHNGLGGALKIAGDLPGAIAEFREAIRIQPKIISGRLNLGLCLIDTKDFPAAEQVIREAIRLDPDSSEGYMMLGRYQVAVKNREGAEAAYRTAVRLQPDNAEAHYRLGLAISVGGDRQGAIPELLEAVRLNPQDGEAFRVLGLTMGAREDSEGAINALRKAVQLQPDNAETHRILGNLLRDRSDFNGAIAELRQAIKLKPDDAGAILNLALSLGSKKEFDEAVKEFRHALQVKPDFFEAHMGLGIILHYRRDLDGAIAAYREATRIQPDNPKSRESLAVVLSSRADQAVGQNQLDEAIKFYRELLKIHPNHGIALFNLGSTLYRKGDIDEALVVFREAIRLDPKSSQAHQAIGRALTAQGKTDEALQGYLEILKKQPEIVELRLLAGDALRKRSRHAEAVDQYREYLKENPKDAEVFGNLGYCLFELKRFDEAVEAGRKSIAINDRVSWVRNLLGCALRDQGKIDEAIAEFIRASELDPKNAYPYRNLGFLYRSQGKYADSLKMFRLGTAADPTLGELKTALVEAERLAGLDARLADVLGGKSAPKDPAEMNSLAEMAYQKGLHVGSVRLRVEAFEAEPSLAANIKAYSRYNAACSASLAGSGRTKEDPLPDDAARIKFREQSRVWLRDDLAAWTNEIETGTPAERLNAVKQLEHWKDDADFVGIRGEPAINQLPESEREGFRTLWADVDRLIARGRESK